MLISILMALVIAGLVFTSVILVLGIFFTVPTEVLAVLAIGIIVGTVLHLKDISSRSKS